MLTIEIDGRELQAKPGQMIIEVADSAGIYIPRFCYHEKLSVAANCRMCLVEVERAPKPLVACATPVADGMKISTNSTVAVDAQKDTLEFLLINHPLDCPICDQGGECPLQDQALGYGGDASRFMEKKRVVADHSIGPLIETEMTRCIHCTRCVRFGEEVAGVMELGLTHRSEHLKIDTFFNGEVESEVSGNVIDLCPVGALTSKPYRFTARSWEMISHNSISPHDCVGTNIDIQTLRGEVKRVLPRVNEQINECWISDRDRYSYEALIRGERLGRPMIRTSAGMIETDWQSALTKVRDEIRAVVDLHGAENIGALVSPNATLEEFYLMQKLVRGLGCENIDHRLRQLDFSSDQSASLYPGLSIPIEELSRADSVLLVGSNIRKEQPLLGLRLRKAWQNGASISSINLYEYVYNFEAKPNLAVPPTQLLSTLAAVLKAVADKRNRELPEDLVTIVSKSADSSDDNASINAIADSLCRDDFASVVILGQTAMSHSDYGAIRQLANAIGNISESALCELPPANSAAGWLAGCLPHRGVNGKVLNSTGMNAWQMMNNPRRGYMLFDVEPPLDMADGTAGQTALDAAEFVLSFQAFSEVPDYVDVVLPIAPFTENSGTFVNCEGKIQWASSAVEPYGEARPGWKILRVLGNFLELDGFDFVSIDEVSEEASPTVEQNGQTFQQANGLGTDKTSTIDPDTLELISEHKIYTGDSVVRRAPALQQTADSVVREAHLNPQDMARFGLKNGSEIRLQGETFNAHTQAKSDTRVPAGCLYLASGVVAVPPIGTAIYVNTH